MAGDEQTIKVASKKEIKNGVIKLRKAPPKHSKPGNWRDGSILEEGDNKTDKASSTAVSPSPVVNQLEDDARDAFATGRPLEDSPELQQCKHCKKNVLKTAATAHINQCLKVKREKAQRKKEAREARERAKEAAREEEQRKADEENGDGKDDDAMMLKAPLARKARRRRSLARSPTVLGRSERQTQISRKVPRLKRRRMNPRPKPPRLKVLLMSNDNVVLYFQTDSPVPGPLLARVIVWVLNELSRVDRSPMTCFWLPTRRRTRRSNRRPR
uniref:Uncharacterized protein n=1 Tax=Bionectria ochroleuca TaxID=29856 RepID=A0A8H7NM61_BIOOC